MTKLEALKNTNPHICFLSLEDTPIHRLFRKVSGDMGGFVKASEKILPQLTNVYVPRDEAMINNVVVQDIKINVFGELPIQAGWNYGGSSTMNGMEWHKSSEVIVACTDLVLLIGDHADITNDIYDASLVQGLFMQKGEAVELLPMTLHLAPLPVHGGKFIAAILLPDGTNLPLESGIRGTKRAVNKWLLVHPENKRGIELGGKIGIKGENIAVRGLDFIS